MCGGGDAEVQRGGSEEVRPRAGEAPPAIPMGIRPNAEATGDSEYPAEVREGSWTSSRSLPVPLTADRWGFGALPSYGGSRVGEENRKMVELSSATLFARLRGRARWALEEDGHGGPVHPLHLMTCSSTGGFGMPQARYDQPNLCRRRQNECWSGTRASCT